MEIGHLIHYRHIFKQGGAIMQIWTLDNGWMLVTGDCPVCQMFPCAHNDISGDWDNIDE